MKLSLKCHRHRRRRLKSQDVGKMFTSDEINDLPDTPATTTTTTATTLNYFYHFLPTTGFMTQTTTTTLIWPIRTETFLFFKAAREFFFPEFLKFETRHVYNCD